MEVDLCVSCRNITLSMLVTGFQRLFDYDQTRAAKDQGCQLCNLAMDAYTNQVCVKSRCDKTHQSPLLWAVSNNGPGVRIGMFRLDYLHFGPHVCVSVPEESSLFQDRIITHRNTQAADSSRNLRLLRSWLEECCSTHGECLRGLYSKKLFDDTTPSVTLPFRVVDVGSVHDGLDLPHLVTTNYKSIGRYLTLSHCWGNVTPPMTTMANCDAWHKAIPWDQLSKTFQDAIKLTRDLGERFLWIDSICIVQDDPADLDAQIRLMGVIFEGSYCTIVAVDAKGTDGSLMVDRGLFLSGPVNNMAARLRLKTGLSGMQPPKPNETYNIQKARLWIEEKEYKSPNEVYEVFLENGASIDPLFLRLREKGWYSRGWVLQERELSRRCIFFTEEGMGWRCNQYWETEQTGVPERRDRHTNFDLETSTTAGNYTYNISCRLHQRWQAFVEDYSKSKLTYISDKDKALKGLEERLSTFFNAMFHFGILDFSSDKEVLHQQLLWLPTNSRGGSLKDSRDFYCPTWSWMIIDGPVHWSPTVFLTQPQLIGQVSFDQAATSQIQKLYITGSGQNINLEAPFLKDLDRATEYDKQFPKTRISWLDAVDAGTNRIISSTGEEMIGWAMFDNADESGEVIAVPLLQYFRLDDEEEPMCVDFLALVKTSRQNEHYNLNGQQWYHRVGRGRIVKDAYTWLESCEPLGFVVV